MNTPICDFVRRYSGENTLRLHMPGHKGHGPLGVETLDITEVKGADSLYEAEGIIRESEDNASQLFGCPTFYSTEGSSQCIRAMLHLATLTERQKGVRPLVAAARNAHKTFLSAVALLDLDVMWLTPRQPDSYLSCLLDPQELNQTLSNAETKPAAVYLTSPDYLGNLSDLESIAKVCHAHDVLLLVDNAHGAYLKFLPQSLHPIDLGADICCDSAHKTLSVLTGGAYLHLSPHVPAEMLSQVKNALALFGSTSPSYLILQSLDAANATLAEGYQEQLKNFVGQVEQCKKHLVEHGHHLLNNEPLKITLRTKPYGYTGVQLAAFLREEGIVCEFADPDFAVMMLTPAIGIEGLMRLEQALLQIPQKKALEEHMPPFHICQPVMSVRDAMFASNEVIPVFQSEGRILSAPSVGCPPAVPIVVCGERIDAAAIETFSYYGIETCNVVR